MASLGRTGFVLLLAALLGACASLLPETKQEVSNPWKNFAAAKQSFDEIVPFQTSLQSVRALGFDPDTTPNMQVLNQAQVISAVLPSPLQDPATVPLGLLQCMRAGAACVGYAMEPSQIGQQRVGYFLLDVLNFRRDTVTTGWKFAALVVVIDGQVVYKQWSGRPQIHLTAEQSNPLGPLQSMGGSLSVLP
jgi:hypothetical protein